VKFIKPTCLISLSKMLWILDTPLTYQFSTSIPEVGNSCLVDIKSYAWYRSFINLQINLIFIRYPGKCWLKIPPTRVSCAETLSFKLFIETIQVQIWENYVIMIKKHTNIHLYIYIKQLNWTTNQKQWNFRFNQWVNREMAGKQNQEMKQNLHKSSKLWAENFRMDKL